MLYKISTKYLDVTFSMVYLVWDESAHCMLYEVLECFNCDERVNTLHALSIILAQHFQNLIKYHLKKATNTHIEDALQPLYDSESHSMDAAHNRCEFLRLFVRGSSVGLSSSCASRCENFCMRDYCIVFLQSHTPFSDTSEG